MKCRATSVAKKYLDLVLQIKVESINKGGVDPGPANCFAILLYFLSCRRRNLNDNKRDNLTYPELKMQPIIQAQRVY